MPNMFTVTTVSSSKPVTSKEYSSQKKISVSEEELKTKKPTHEKAPDPVDSLGGISQSLFPLFRSRSLVMEAHLQAQKRSTPSMRGVLAEKKEGLLKDVQLLLNPTNPVYLVDTPKQANLDTPEQTNSEGGYSHIITKKNLGQPLKQKFITSVGSVQLQLVKLRLFDHNRYGGGYFFVDTTSQNTPKP